MKYLIISMFACILFVSNISLAEDIKTTKYSSDPIFVPLYDGAPHPLASMITMAENGDKRAQFILADLYSKGKGGFKKDLNKAKYWFEQVAKQKDIYGFIRLAAIAKNENKPIIAYNWYLAGLKYAKSKNKKLVAFIKKQQKELVTKYKLKNEDIKQAKKLAKNWIKTNRPQKFAQKQASYNN